MSEREEEKIESRENLHKLIVDLFGSILSPNRKKILDKVGSVRCMIFSDCNDGQGEKRKNSYK